MWDSYGWKRRPRIPPAYSRKTTRHITFLHSPCIQELDTAQGGSHLCHIEDFHLLHTIISTCSSAAARPMSRGFSIKTFTKMASSAWKP